MSFEFTVRTQRTAFFGAVLVGMAVLMMAGTAGAGTLVYTPTNPSFGGNPLNGSTLLGSAQAQNQHLPSSGSSGSGSTPLTQGQIFAQQLTSQLYASLANSITKAIFGDSAQPTGTFTFAGTTISYQTVIVDGIQQVQLTINDGSTITTVTLPKTAIGN